MSFSGSQLSGLRGSVRLRALFGLGLAFALSWGCTTPVDLPDVNAISFSTQDSVLVGGTVQLHPVITDVNGRPISGHRVTYQALNPAAATVDENGVVTGVATGTGLFRVTAGGVSAQTGVKVLSTVTRVVLAPQSDLLSIGQTRALTITMTDAGGLTVSGRAVVWRSQNPTVALVNAQGVVSAISVGTAVITGGTDLDKIYGQSTITVTNVAVNSVRITPIGPQILRIGNTLQLSATAYDAQNQPLNGRTITWQSSNPTVLSVTQNGLVTALATGSGNITAESEGRQTSLSITVTAIPISSITFNPAVDVLIPGDPKQYNPVVVDSAGNTVTSFVGRSVSWQSSNLPVASVAGQAQGAVVNAGLPGTAFITVTIDGKTSNNLQINVVQVSTIQITPSPVNLTQGNPSQQLGVTLKDASGNTLTSTRPYSYLSQNASCVSVSATGLVTALYPTNVSCPTSVQVLVGAGGVTQPVVVNIN